MLNTLRIESVRTAGLKATVAAILLASSGASMAASYTLCATSGSATMPGTLQLVDVLGYTAGACGAVTSPGGPVLEAIAGEPVTVTLHNGLPSGATEATGLVFQGQAMPPDLAGTLNGADKVYTFTPANPGTYLYQAAPLANAEHQTAMGLYGALVVRPANVLAPFSRTDANVGTTLGSIVVTDAAASSSDVGASVSGTGIPAGATVVSFNAGVDFTLSVAATATGTISLALNRSSGQAYAAGTAFDEEATLVLSEIDPALNFASAAAFDMRNLAPKYFLINGKAYPDTLPITSAAGHKLLLRYVNAGSKHHSMGVLGLRQSFIAKDGNVLPTADVAVTAETLATGQTGDALVVMPTTLAAASQFAVYEASLNLHNSGDQGIGGMLTFVKAGAGAAVAGPSASGALGAPSPTNGTANVTLSAAVTSTGTIDLVEYFADTQGANGTGTAMALSGSAATATILAANVAGLGSGNHTFYVHGHDATGWGSYASAVLTVDMAGPATSALTLTPNPSNGTVAVALSASASDVATGGANVDGGAYIVDGAFSSTTPGTTMTLGGVPATVRSLTASIPSGLSVGDHVVSVRSHDSKGNWGLPATIKLTVTTSGPATSNVALLPGNANNGSYGLSSGQPVVRVTALETSSAATVAGAEGFIDTACPAVGTRGFPFVPVDGVWGGATESVSADIPLANIASLALGPHTINVRGKDSTGAWGACATTPGSLLIDKAAPVLASLSGTVTPTAVAFGGTVTLAGIAGVVYWFDSATQPAAPRVANAVSAGGSSYTATLSLGNLGGSGGTHTVYFKARDAANNVSANQGKTANNALTVVQARADNYQVNASNGLTQSGNVNANNGVLGNDLPSGGTPRTATPGTPVVTKTGGGVGTMAVTLNANGSFSYTLTVPNTVTGNANIRAAKRGTYTFQYTFTRDTITTTGTVSIRVR